MRTGALIGYAWVSTTGQLLDSQQRALAEAGCLRVLADKLSGKNADRPELAACLDYMRPTSVAEADLPNSSQHGNSSHPPRRMRTVQ